MAATPSAYTVWDWFRLQYPMSGVLWPASLVRVKRGKTATRVLKAIFFLRGVSPSLIFFFNCSAQPELSFEHHNVARQAFYPEIQPREPPQLPLLATFVVSLGFLLSMTRRKVDEEQVRKACAAIDDGMSVRKAAEVFGVGRTSIEDRRRGKVAMNAKVGPETILSKEEEDSLEDIILLFASRNFLAVDRVHLRDAVRRLCNDGRQIPWDPEKGPGKDWLAGFLRRHPRVVERSTRIYEANRITEDEEPRMVQFYERWAALLDEVKPEANHMHAQHGRDRHGDPPGPAWPSGRRQHYRA
ncbi:unnamed protein product [Ectocarpus sp. 13 AM-2016]